VEDLRLVGPALVAWGVVWAMTGGSWIPVAVLAVLLVAFGGARWVLVSIGAAVVCAGLAAAETEQGPVAELARHGGEARFELVLHGDPAPTAAGVAVAAEVERLGGVRVHTPVTVRGTGPLAAAWSGLLPSTRVEVPARAVRGRAGGVLLLARGAPRILRGPSAVQRLAGRLRSGLRRAVEGLPQDPRGLLPGLVIGDVSGIPPDLVTAFEETDLLHLISVSGSNLSVVLVAVIGPLGRARTRERGGVAAWLGLPLRCTALAGAALAVGFVVLCRPGASMLRAAATGLIGLLALAVGRRAHALPALAGAVLLLVLLEPSLAHSYGFALSVFATAGRIVLGRRWTEALTARGWPHRLAEAVACAAATQAFCAPLLVVRAARVSLLAVPCNLLAELAVGPATLLGFVTLGLAPLSLPAARLAAEVAAVPTTWIADVARYGAAVPNAQIDWPGGLWGALTLLAVLAAAVAAAPVLRRPLPLLALALLLLLALLRPPPVIRVLTGWPPADWDLVACDVGQGDALVVHTAPGTALVVDAGPDPRLIDDCLRSLGVTRVPLLILTHDFLGQFSSVSRLLPGDRWGRDVRQWFEVSLLSALSQEG
jgi:competence protein ComEC